MEELQVIHQQTLFDKEFKIYGSVEEPLFLAKDVAEWIEHTNATLMLKNVDEDEKKLDYVLDSSGQRRKASFLTENGLYEVLMQSRKPIAKQFKKKVKEVLKSIRKHGAYMTEQTLEKAITSPDFLIKLATKLKEEQEARKLAENKVVELTPRAKKFDEVVDSHRLLTFEAVANMVVEHMKKKYGISIRLTKQNFTKILRTMCVLTKDRKFQGGGFKNLPRSAYQYMFAVKVTKYGNQTKVKPEFVLELIELVCDYILKNETELKRGNVL